MLRCGWSMLSTMWVFCTNGELTRPGRLKNLQMRMRRTVFFKECESLTISCFQSMECRNNWVILAYESEMDLFELFEEMNKDEVDDDIEEILAKLEISEQGQAMMQCFSECVHD